MDRKPPLTTGTGVHPVVHSARARFSSLCIRADCWHAERSTTFDAAEILLQDKIATHGGSYAMFADMFRYLLLYLKGGWWSDLDMLCLRPWNF